MSNSPKSSKSGVREFPLDDEMKGLKFRRIYAIIQDEKLYIENGKATITSRYTDDLETTTKALEQTLIESPEFEKKVVDTILMFIARTWYAQSQQDFASVVNGLEEEPVDKCEVEGEDGKTRKVYVQKYSTGIDLAEGILIEGTKPRFLQIIDGKAKLSKDIPLPGNISLCPLDKWSHQSLEYEFSSEEEIDSYIERAKKETHDSLYKKIKSEWEKYVDADNFHPTICSADTFFTYFQDKLGMTHYLLFVGGNDVGKTNNLTLFQRLAYRPLNDMSITAANIYRFLGSVEEGQGIILADEIDDLEEQKDKMKIYKGGN